MAIRMRPSCAALRMTPCCVAFRPSWSRPSRSRRAPPRRRAGHDARRPGRRRRPHQDLHQSRRHLGVEPRPRARGLRHRHRRERPGADHRLSDGGGARRRDRHQRRPHLAGDRRRLRPRDRLRPAAHARAAEDQAARLRQVGGRQGAGPGAGGELRRRRHGAAGACRQPPRVHRKLGVSGRGRDLHQPAASGLERGRADQPRGQAGRRRLADRRRRQRRQRASPGNMFVPIDLLAPILGDLLAKGRVAGPGRPWLGVNAQAVHGRLFVGRVAPGSPARAGRPQARRHHRRRQRREDPHAVGVLSQGLGARRRRRHACRSTCCRTASRAASRCNRSTGSTRSSCSRRSR